LNIFLRFFWCARPYADIKSQDVATKLFDFSVNAGPGNAARLVQQVLLDRERLVQSDLDGVLGPVTVAAINFHDPQDLLARLAVAQRCYYEKWISIHPDAREKFRRGLLARAAWTHT
jgi:lysozyme family protein